MSDKKAAFDAVAAEYDQQFTHTPTGDFQRKLVHHYIDSCLLSSTQPLSVLELNCGTGADALHLLKQNCKVLATDISAQMVHTARQKAAKLTGEEQQRIRFQTLAAQDVLQLKAQAPFDLVFSNFGGLNCISPQAFQQLAADLNQLLAPGGQAVFVIMSRFSWWETAYFLAKANWKAAWRRRSQTPIDAPLAEGLSVKTWYYSPTEVADLMYPYFRLNQKQGIGFTIPPSYLDPFFAKRPKLLNWLWTVEQRLVQWPFLAAQSDHFLLHFVKQ